MFVHRVFGGADFSRMRSLADVRCRGSTADEGSDAFPGDGPANIAGFPEIKHLDGQLMFHAHGQCGEVHDAQLPFDRLIERLA